MGVIDASALIEFLLNASRFPRLDDVVREHELHAPHLIDIETVHSFRHAVFGKRLEVSRPRRYRRSIYLSSRCAPAE